MSHALLYASGGTIDPTQVPSDYDRLQSLWCILQESPFLLVFDGAERLLRAYHTLDAAYRGDDFSEETGDNHLRCADPRVGQFLQWLASSGTKTRTLLTTRLHPKELEGLAGCCREELEHLEADDAVEFMRRQGVRGPRNAIAHACQPYDFLPLCIRLLAGAIREDPAKPDDIAAAEGWHPPANLKDTQRQHHILQVAYETMARDRRELLSRIAALRGPLDYATAKVLSTYENESELKEALRELVARGLLLRREGRGHYDLHPIVRRYAYDRLGDKAATHKALKDYFDTIPEPDTVESLLDLMPAIELFHHTIRAGRYEEAYMVYRDRLTNALYYQLGAYDVDISLKQAFFPQGEDKPPRLREEKDQAWVLNDLATSYSRIGESRKAVELQERSNAIDKEHSDIIGLAIGLRNLATTLTLVGELEQAQSNLRAAIQMDRDTADSWHEAVARAELGLVLTFMGQYADSAAELDLALTTFAEAHDDHTLCTLWSHRALRAMLMDDPESSLQNTAKARQLAERLTDSPYPVRRDIIRIRWLSGMAKCRLADPAGAEADLDEALSRCRRIRLVEFETDILLEMAKLQWQKAKDGGQRTEEEAQDLIEQAKSLTREALEIADRCEYRLKQADIHNFLAEMAMAEGDKATALKHAGIAKERAWCDGPPYCYRKALDEAEQMLAKLH